MERKKFMQIIKLRSVWKIDKRRGDYTLPNGTKLSEYVERLVRSQMAVDHLAVRKNGDLCMYVGGTLNTEAKKFEDFELIPAFEENEICSYEVMERRISDIVFDLIH